MRSNQILVIERSNNTDQTLKNNNLKQIDCGRSFEPFRVLTDFSQLLTETYLN